MSKVKEAKEMEKLSSIKGFVLNSINRTIELLKNFERVDLEIDFKNCCCCSNTIIEEVHESGEYYNANKLIVLYNENGFIADVFNMLNIDFLNIIEHKNNAYGIYAPFSDGDDMEIENEECGEYIKVATLEEIILNLEIKGIELNDYITELKK